MAFNAIETGYKPEGALGALYQGYNAADAQSMNELDMIKQYLANQKQEQLNPIEVAQAQQTLDSGAYKTRPEYQNAMTDIQVGQGMSNLAAGTTAKGLQPFKQKTEQMDLERQQGELRNLSQIQMIDDALSGTGDNGEPANPLPPGMRELLLQRRHGLINRFKETPKFAGQRELTETKTDSAEHIAELNLQLKEAQAIAKASQERPMTMSQMEAHMRNRFAQNPQDAEARQFLDVLERYRQNIAPAQGGVTLDPATKKLTTNQGNLSAPSTGGNPTGQGNDLQAQIMAELARRRQQQGK